MDKIVPATPAPLCGARAVTPPAPIRVPTAFFSRLGASDTSSPASPVVPAETHLIAPDAGPVVPPAVGDSMFSENGAPRTP